MAGCELLVPPQASLVAPPPGRAPSMAGGPRPDAAMTEDQVPGVRAG